MRAFHVLDALSPDIIRADVESRPGDVLTTVDRRAITHVAVFEAERYCGLLTLREMLLSSPQRIFGDLVRAPAAPTVRPDASACEIAQVMKTAAVDGVAVVDAEGGFVGVVTSQSLCAAVMEAQHEDLVTQAASSAQQLRAVLDNAADGIVTIDEQGTVHLFNQAAVKMFGYDADQVVGRNISMLMPSPYRDEHDGYVRRHLETGEKRVIGIRREAVGRRSDGSSFPIELHVSALPHGDGPRFVGIVSDITERKQAEDAQRRAKEEAEAANRSKTEFLANMSHEIRTPMTAILGFAECLLDPDLPADDRRDAVETISRNGNQLLAIIDDILDLSKIEAGKQVVRRVACSVSRLIADVHSLMQGRAEAKGLRFTVECAGPLPETIETDPVRLRQILVNLVGNAIKFTDAGTVRVVVRSIPVESRLLIDVIDTGTGLTAAEVSRLFQPFTQADNSATRRHGGTGLGLAISQRFALLLGGDIHVISQPGQGSTFRVTLGTGSLAGVKMIDNPTFAVEGAAPARGAIASEAGASLANVRILIAEDGPDNQRLIRHVVERAGAVASVVENGRLAIASAWAAHEAGTPFDVILMDMQMPVMDGYAATANLRDHGYTAPIIALTAHAMAADHGKCLAAGCDGYAAKPIDRAALIETIHRHLPQLVPA